MTVSIVVPTAYLETPVSHIAEYVKLIEQAGRTCYKSEDRISDTSGDTFVRSLIRRGHESVLEHCSITYRIIMSRACSHQLVRHRLCAFCVDGDAITSTTISGIGTNGRKFSKTKQRSIKQLFEMKQTSHGRSRLKLVKLNCINEQTGIITQGKVQDVVYTGKKACYHIVTEDGYQIRATKDHLFYTPDGWKRLEEILQGEKLVATNGITPPSKNELEDLYITKQKTANEIATLLQISYGSVRKLLSIYRIERSHIVPPTREWLEEEYLIKNRLRSDIATELNISEPQLGKYIRQFRLQKPAAKRPGKKAGYGRKGMFTHEAKRKISARMKGPGNPQWRGGITARAIEVRKEITPELRKQVYQRDGYLCRLGNHKAKKLTLHHVVPVWQNESLIADPRNLVTVCEDCHYKLNGHEHEFTEFFMALEPVQPRPNISKANQKKIIKFSKIVRYQEVDPIDTYDIVMQDPHHNFIANGFVVHNSQESMRYCDYGKLGFQVIVPPSLLQCRPENLTLFMDECERAYLAYCELRNAGVPPEDARFILPNASKTEVVVSSNLRNWRHMIKERGLNKHAQWEIRKLFQDVLYELNTYLPAVFGDLVEELQILKEK